MKIRMFVAISLLALSQAVPAQDLEIHTLGDQLQWHTDLAFGAATISLVGPEGYQSSTRVAAGDALAITVDAELDGLYRWQVRLASPDTRTSRREGADPREARRARGAAESRLFAGAFRIVAGALTLPGELREPEPVTKDDVVNDDLIANHSLCVGTGCSNGEDFGFDTIRLRENNLRIHFDDNSLSPYPRRDWRLVANSLSSGGDEYFSIQDATFNRHIFRLEAGAPSWSMFIDENGVGLGTTQPTQDLHIASDNTPTLRLDQGIGGFGPQVWDVGGNESYFFVRDVTGGSNYVLRMRTGAPANSLVVHNDGNVGVGASVPSADLEVVDLSGGDSADLLVHHQNGGGASLAVTSLGGSPTQRNLVELRNNGKISMVMFNESTMTADWELSHDGNFNINALGVGSGNEVSLNTAGDLTISGSLVALGGDGVADPGDVFPDYVFEDDYPLMPLAELEAFIETNGHLPAVPSKDEISRAGGINMTQLQLSMLEKIEELTLYTLAQEEKLRRQSEQIESLTARLAAEQ